MNKSIIFQLGSEKNILSKFSHIREEIEKILQETLFEPRSLQEQTVADAMEQTLKIRDEVLSRTQDLRTGEIEICPEQGVNQEAFLTQIRMEIMTVLLSLIEPEAASTEALKVQL